jgi:putative endonuclease
VTAIKKTWFVYLLRCSDDSIYTGISTDIDARVTAHNQGKGASYTSGRRPVSLIYQEKHPNRSSASRREAEIKNWRREQKEKFVQATS